MKDLGVRCRWKKSCLRREIHIFAHWKILDRRLLTELPKVILLCAFYSPLKKIFITNSEYPPLKILNPTWKILKTVRETATSVLYAKISLGSHVWKFLWVTRKITVKLQFQILTWNRVTFCKQSSESRHYLEIPIIWKFSTFFWLLEKKKPKRENFQKYRFCARKNKKPVSEKIPKCALETIGRPVRNRKLVCVNAIFCALKNLKRPHIRFAQTFYFYGGEKQILLDGVCSTFIKLLWQWTFFRNQK